MEQRQINLCEMQNYLTNILEKFDLFCNENGLTYFAGYGTLLGSVRHEGFIPWDDDIDIMMPRDDYNKLLTYEYIDADHRYQIISRGNRHDWPYPFAKCVDNRTELKEDNFNSGTLGVYIDLFPIDGLPKSSIGRKIHMKNLYFWHYLLITLQKKSLKGSSNFRTIVKYAVYPFAKLLGVERIVAHIDSIGEKHPYNKSDFVASQMICVYGNRECVERRLYSSRIRRKFGCIKIWIPEGYEQILRSLYGDYMKLPPEEKRITHHIYKVWIKE